MWKLFFVPRIMVPLENQRKSPKCSRCKMFIGVSIRLKHLFRVEPHSVSDAFGFRLTH